MHGLQAARGARSLTRVYGILLAVAAVVAALDQATKQVALETLDDGAVDLAGGLVSLRLTYNTGGAFGLLEGVPGFFLAATIGIVVVILVWAGRLGDDAPLVPLGLVLGGGLGNLYDRVFRPLDGGVVDFIDLHFWPVFNVADSAITLGVGALLLAGLRSGAHTGARPE